MGFGGGAEVFAYDTLIDPLNDFSPFNTRIHGIAWEHIFGKPSFAQVHAIVSKHFKGRTAIAHSSFDKGVLTAACLRHALALIETDWLDSAAVARAAWSEQPNHKLGTLTLFLKLHHRHHDALSDARAAGMVVVRAMAHTGCSLADWRAPPRRSSAPQPAVEGPLKDAKIAILGSTKDGSLARHLAAHGAWIMVLIGTTKTMLIVSNAQPFGRFVHAHADYRRAEELRRGSATIDIVWEDVLRARIGA
ncbi:MULTISPECIES: exonuclease domain-containing protein [unclassified Sphingomonas]|uniref:exonuclease domain-containing protein n=1 Tax=unclassified Sphingomonas TaxID=196159 RepID=UPI000AB5B28C|nr:MULTISPECIES: exonuclease domain-containing protein [unclassified Sphingomonas]